MGYLRNRTSTNLERLISTPGSRLAYTHHRWSSVPPIPTIEEFWKRESERIDWNEQLEASIEEIIQCLKGQERQWLGAVLKYLPRGHVFDTKVYLIGGYDSVVYGRDVALNLTSKQFHADHREAVYYLVHELAHAGYFRYHRMPELVNLNTTSGLLDVVKLLTHLEGMGVVSSFEKRMKEGGLLDNDYKVLLDDNERNARVRDYFTLLSRLENAPDRKLRKKDCPALDDFSARPKRLWYIAGGHMALKIEEEYGTATLRRIVMKGHEAFFKTYAQIENPLLD